VAPEASKTSFTAFKPSANGFHFRNDFEGSPLPFNTGSSKLPTRFGLCGGMSFAVADYFIAGREPPADATPPKEGTTLYNYLYRRQAVSIGPMGVMGFKFMDWMRLPDSGPDSTHSRTLADLPAITAAIGRAEPVMLGLVYVSTKQTLEPWTNHQVLAYGETADGGITEIHIYDSNFPGRDDVVIRITRADDDATLSEIVPGRRIINVRGLFRMSYTPSTPP
jgi:hypothetical protein